MFNSFNLMLTIENLRKGAKEGNAEMTFIYGAALVAGFGCAKNVRKGLQLVERAAMKGETTAMVYLGEMYLKGVGVRKDYAMAEKYLAMAAELNNQDALFLLYCMYDDMEWSGHNPEMACSSLFKAASLGHEKACLEAGCRLFREGRIDEAENYLTGLCKKGIPEAQALLGEIHFDKGNYAEAARLLGKAAKKKMPGTIFLLARCHANGLGVAKDEKKAFRELKGLANYGRYDILHDAALMYLDGGCMPLDKKKGIELMKISAKGGFTKAIYDLGCMYVSGTECGKNYKEAFVCFTKAAELGHVKAIRSVGVCYSNGWGVEKNEDMAVSYFKKACKLGDCNAKYDLAYAYFYGLGIGINRKKAFALFSELVDAGYKEAYLALGRCYEDGYGTDENMAKARELYKKYEESSDVNPVPDVMTSGTPC